MTEYVSGSGHVQSRMIAARYFDVNYPKETMEFMIKGLNYNPETASSGLQIIALDPPDIKDLVQKFNRISSYKDAAIQQKSKDIYTGHMYTSFDRWPAQTRNTRSERQHRAARITKPNFKP